MSIIDAPTPQILGHRRESWLNHAKRHGVTVRTLDRWAAKGIIDSPEYINGRKYADPDAKPRQDDAD